MLHLVVLLLHVKRRVDGGVHERVRVGHEAVDGHVLVQDGVVLHGGEMDQVAQVTFGVLARHVQPEEFPLGLHDVEDDAPRWQFNNSIDSSYLSGCFWDHFWGRFLGHFCPIELGRELQ